MPIMEHRYAITVVKAFVGDRSGTYYQTVCSCGVFRSGLESSRMHAVEEHRNHVVIVAEEVE